MHQIFEISIYLKETCRSYNTIVSVYISKFQLDEIKMSTNEASYKSLVKKKKNVIEVQDRQNASHLCTTRKAP